MEQLGERVEWATIGMVVLEVCRGLRDPAVRERFAARYSTMIYLPTPNGVWEYAAEMAWTLDRRGSVIPAQDIVIAAVCLSRGARLLTPEIPGRII